MFVEDPGRHKQVVRFPRILCNQYDKNGQKTYFNNYDTRAEKTFYFLSLFWILVFTRKFFLIFWMETTPYMTILGKVLFVVYPVGNIFDGGLNYLNVAEQLLGKTNFHAYT